MNGLAAASQETLSNDADQRIASVRRAILVAASSLVLIVLGETWDRGPGGRPANDPVKMFKLLVVQRYYNLSDEQTEYQVSDRLSFQKFAGWTVADKVPDANKSPTKRVAMKTTTPKTEPSPSTQPRKVVFGASLKKEKL